MVKRAESRRRPTNSPRAMARSRRRPSSASRNRRAREARLWSAPRECASAKPDCETVQPEPGAGTAAGYRGRARMTSKSPMDRRRAASARELSAAVDEAVAAPCPAPRSTSAATERGPAVREHRCGRWSDRRSRRERARADMADEHRPPATASSAAAACSSCYRASARPRRRARQSACGHGRTSEVRDVTGRLMVSSQMHVHAVRAGDSEVHVSNAPARLNSLPGIDVLV